MKAWYIRHRSLIAGLLMTAAVVAVLNAWLGPALTRFVMSCIAFFIISITMLARANDQEKRGGLKWQSRLVGFVMAGTAPIGVAYYELVTESWPSLYEVCFRWGVTIVFMTTPYMKPWWNYIKGED